MVWLAAGSAADGHAAVETVAQGAFAPHAVVAANPSVGLAVVPPAAVAACRHRPRRRALVQSAVAAIEAAASA